MYLNKSSRSHFSLVAALVLSVAISIPTSVMAQAKAKSPANQTQAEPSPEMKKNMADMYQKMADCLKTEKSMHECHKEVMKDCPMAKENGSCPLMEGMKGMEGMKSMNMDHSEHK